MTQCKTIGAKPRGEIISEYRVHDKDNGSVDVQIAILTHRINHLVTHLKQHKRDNHTRHGLLLMVGRRRRLMSYLKRTDAERFSGLVKRLKLG